MAFVQFPSVLLIKTFDTSEIVHLGNIKITDGGELFYIRSLVFVGGTITGPERIRLRLHTTNDFTKNYAVSEWTNLNEITPSPNLFLGWLRFDFSRENLSKQFFYRVTAEMGNYTRNGDTFYVGISYDYPFPVNPTGISPTGYFLEHPLTMQNFVYKPKNI